MRTKQGTGNKVDSTTQSKKQQATGKKKEKVKTKEEKQRGKSNQCSENFGYTLIHKFGELQEQYTHKKKGKK